MSTGIPFVRDMDFEYGKAQRITPRIQRVVARNPSSFTFYGTGTYIVDSGEPGGNVAVIDPGPLYDDHVAALLSAIGDATVSHILVTHTHIDHSPAAAPLKKVTGAPTYGFGPHGSGQAPDKMRIMEGGDLEFTPDVVLKDEDVIEGDGWTFEAVHTPGHTSNHVCFALKEEKVLFSGDHVMGWSTSVISPPDGDMQVYIASLTKLLARDDTTYWPTHGPAITDPKRHVEALITHRERRDQAILTALAKGKTTVPDMVAYIYRGVPRNLHPAAGHTVLAHLIHLVEIGRVVCDGGPTAASEYNLVD
ncbi:MAG: MBL fold metallo-hydrolase [Rhodospirillales bacterium]|nr:MBL fold metallo-hydrolase [Rhodospirillales bacterium]